MGSSDKEKHLGKVLSNERPKDHGSVRKKGRPKSQDMSDLISADIQIERGACNAKGNLINELIYHFSIVNIIFIVLN